MITQLTPPEYVLYCEECQRKVAHTFTVNAADCLITLTCNLMHVTHVHVSELLLCYSTHCEDEAP